MTLMSKTGRIFVHDEFMATEEASRSGATVILKTGEWCSGTTHNLAVIWPDYASMQSSLTANAMSQPGLLLFPRLATLFAGNSMFAATGLSTKRLSCNNLIKSDVLSTSLLSPHRGAYVEELQKLWESCDDLVTMPLSNYGDRRIADTCGSSDGSER